MIILTMVVYILIKVQVLFWNFWVYNWFFFNLYVFFSKSKDRPLKGYCKLSNVSIQVDLHYRYHISSSSPINHELKHEKTIMIGPKHISLSSTSVGSGMWSLALGPLCLVCTIVTQPNFHAIPKFGIVGQKPTSLTTFSEQNLGDPCEVNHPQWISKSCSSNNELKFGHHTIKVIL